MMSRLKPRRTNLIYEMGSFQPWINVQCLADFGSAGVSPAFFQCGKIRKSPARFWSYRTLSSLGYSATTILTPVGKSKPGTKGVQLRERRLPFRGGVCKGACFGVNENARWGRFAGPIAHSMQERFYFFFDLGGASPTFVVIPTPMACRDSRPCLACAPIGPFGSRSIAC
jgi:hypothetical protein